MVEGLTLFFCFFSPWLIMNLLCKGKGSAATSLFVPFSGDPREQNGNVAFPPTCGPREGTGEVAISDFVPFSRDPRACRGKVAGGATPSNKSTTYHAPPPPSPFQIFFTTTYIPQNDQREKAVY